MSGRKPLLHVEDDAFVIRAVGRWLATLGIEVQAAATCEEARTLAGRARFGCGIFDLDLPDGDGITLANELLDAGVVQHAVFYTASRDSAALARAAQIGKVVEKGPEMTPLLAAVSRAQTDSDFPVAPVSGVEGETEASTG